MAVSASGVLPCIECMKEFIRDNLNSTIYVTVGVLVSSFFSYLLQWFMGRQLSVPDFGTFNTLLSMGAIISVPTTVLSTSIVKRVASLLGRNDFSKINAFYWNITSVNAFLFLSVFLLLVVFRQQLLGFVGLKNNVLSLVFAFYVGLTFFQSAPYAYVQGLLLYKRYSFYVALTAFFRFLIPSVMIYFSVIENSLIGVFTGIVGSIILVYLLSFPLLKRYIYPVVKLNTKDELIKALKFSVPVMLTNVALMALINNDLILVKRFFSAEDAGYYAGAVTLGKILLFSASAVSVIMFPKIAALKETGHGMKKAFHQLLALQVAIVLAGLLVFVSFPKLIALAFFGDKFINSVQYLSLLSIAITFYVVLNFLVLFLLAVDVTNVYVFLLPILITQYGLITIYHPDIFTVIKINISIMFLGTVLTYYKSLHWLKT